ncbi:antitoxin Xre/MbcA/ParS toxin-binding domain-containing protein [Alteromonas sp. ASW11-130]|uniref:antitoxin Xre/MbcA/ParS toxin-binding domain-containing protein n=1 Tax=Alteromonas sp. ASW11-130 TaxID=3015775 RepID=UPI002241D7D3|nr:antitoxin Xre/MbcA/ParS toxin-binding domain-containing protein [Alteromonas sp. ASW11-130]MCW8093181.1 DUF2384 domain-containing protein [Alteromonas sp. ASW11-130]
MAIAHYQPAVIMKAFTWAYEELGLSPNEASAMLGVSEQGLLQTALVGFEIESSEAKIQLAFIRLYHLLYALSDGDNEKMIIWFTQPNLHLAATPKAMCNDIEGLLCLNEYLEGMQSASALPDVNFALAPQTSPTTGPAVHR